jgi:hypothetical protein
LRINTSKKLKIPLSLTFYSIIVWSLGEKLSLSAKRWPFCLKDTAVGSLHGAGVQSHKKEVRALHLNAPSQGSVVSCAILYEIRREVHEERYSLLPRINRTDCKWVPYADLCKIHRYPPLPSTSSSIIAQPGGKDVRKYVSTLPAL